MVIQHNILSMYGERALGKSKNALRKSTGKLASGYKINCAGDDAAKLAISEKMRGQIRGLDQTVQNAEDGISMVQTADSAMGEIQSIIHRMRELSVQSANDTNTASDRDAIQREIDALANEIIRTANGTEYNTRKVLKGAQEMTTKSVTGTLDDLRKVYQNVKNVQKIESVITEEVKVPVNYTKNSMPEWVLGTNPLYAQVQTTNTGRLTEEIDLGEKEYFYQVQYKKTDGSTVVTLTSSKSIYENNKRLVQAKLYTDTAGESKVTQTFADGTTTDVTFSDFEKNNRNMANYLSKQVADANGERTLMFDYSRTEEIITHNGGVMDFSNLNKDNISELVEENVPHGFNATCTACDKHYSISFVAGTGNKGYCVPGEYSYIYEIDIQDLIDKANAGQDVTGEDLVNKVLDTLAAMDKNSTTGIESDYATFSSAEYDSQSSSVDGIKFQHHQALLKDSNNPSALVFIDTWDYGQGSIYGNRGTFDPIVYEGEETKVIWKHQVTNINLDDPIASDPNKIYTMYYDAQEPLRIQVGANGGQELAITMPDISLAKLGMDELNVLTHADAAFSIERCDYAINYLNSERSRMGAYQNRMEHIVNGNSNTSENLQSSESRLRDTDMAEEMTRFSKENIIAQAGQAMLVQANQSTQGVLGLLQQ